MHAAAQAGAAEVALLGRDAARAHATLKGYQARLAELVGASIDLPAACERHRSLREICEQVSFLAASYDQATAFISAADLIVDATPLGMKPGDPAPFDLALLRANQTIFDVVYGHGETALAVGARTAGARFLDGPGMLVGQAVATVRIVCDVNGVDCPLSDDELFVLMAKAAGFDC